jgi:hypothetical protein
MRIKGKRKPCFQPGAGFFGSLTRKKASLSYFANPEQGF